jgi:hypothetical protein
MLFILYITSSIAVLCGTFLEGVKFDTSTKQYLHLFCRNGKNGID